MEEVSFKPSFVCAFDLFKIKITKIAAEKYFMDKLSDLVVILKSFITSLIIFILTSLFFISCKDNKCIDSPDVSSIEVSVNLERLDKKLHKIPTKNDLHELLVKNRAFAEEFLNLSQYPTPGILVDRYYNLLNSSDIDSLFIEVDNTFGNLEDIRIQFE